MNAGRVLFVEDETSISEPLAEILRMEGYETVVVPTVAEGLAAAAHLDPDVVLLDLMLPDGSGRDLCRTLRRDSDVPIIMITARGQVHERIVGLEIGADDYLVKPVESAEVIARIGALLRRSRRTAREAPNSIRVGDLVLHPQAREVVLAGEPVRLSRKEFDLLLELARNLGRVVRREDLMTKVWDENWWGPTRTLDVHIGSLRRKLRDTDRTTPLIHTVRGVGFRLADPGQPPAG